jgi:hypothetical protein
MGLPAYPQAWIFAQNHQSCHLVHKYTNQGGTTEAVKPNVFTLVTAVARDREGERDWESMAALLTHGRAFLRG